MCAQVLVGEATSQTLVDVTVALDVPAVKIDEIVATVTELNCTVIAGKVIFQGVLHEQIFFVDEGGLVRHRAQDVRFAGFIPFAGAGEGMECTAEAVIEFIDFRLLDPLTLRQIVVLLIKISLFDPPPGLIFSSVPSARQALFFGAPKAYRTSGRRRRPAVFTTRPETTGMR
ncbi:MAG: DUF3794 domain-containing protein [Firmicutes bacterium]|nr:DUF3794 domain-containing protein [Bacillota bacterium]